MMKNAIFILLIGLTCSSCSKVFYGATFVDCVPKADTNFKGPLLRIVNVGKVGISSVKLETKKGFVTICGVKPGDTGNYFCIPNFCKDIYYEISILHLRGWNKAKGWTFLSGKSIYEPTCEEISTGSYSFVINVKRHRNKLLLSSANILKD